MSVNNKNQDETENLKKGKGNNHFNRRSRSNVPTGYEHNLIVTPH